VAAASLLAGVVSAGPALAHGTVWSPDDFRVIAHRGAHGAQHDEDTVDSQVTAMKQGASCAETDLRISHDGHFVEMHDATVDRTTNGTGYVYQLSYDYIRSLRTDKTQQQVPTLEESLAAMQPLDGCLHMEITGIWWTPAKFIEMRDLIAAYGMLDRVFPFSANKDYLRAMHTYTPELQTIWKAYEPVDESDIYDLGVMAVIPRVEHVTPDTVNRMHAIGVKVFSPLANGHIRWRELVDMGVDGLMTNKTIQFLKWYGG